MKEIKTQMEMYAFKYRYQQVLGDFKQEFYKDYLEKKFSEEYKVWVRERVGGNRGAHQLNVENGISR